MFINGHELNADRRANSVKLKTIRPLVVSL